MNNDKIKIAVVGAGKTESPNILQQVFDRVSALVDRGWLPTINLLPEQLGIPSGWHCCLIHRDCPPPTWFNDRGCMKAHDQPLRVSVDSHRTMAEAIIAACDIAELLDVNIKTT